VTRDEGLGIDPDYLREHQYKDPQNLNARIALHARYTKADEPWYAWLARRLVWPEDGDVLEVGCGSGALWVQIAPLLPRLRLTLTDLSDGMVAAAAAAVAALPSIELAAARTSDVRDLPFGDEVFDVVVANHMLYHVPDPRLAAAQFARVLRPGGVLMAATNGPRHLGAIGDISREVLGWSPFDATNRRFGLSGGEEVLRAAFASVTWHLHPSTMVCTDPADVVAFLESSTAGQEASPAQRVELRDAVRARFAQGGGQLAVQVEAGCFIARDPTPGPA
jgi:SAM-dependent methyltransferase